MWKSSSVVVAFIIELVCVQALELTLTVHLAGRGQAAAVAHSALAVSERFNLY